MRILAVIGAASLLLTACATSSVETRKAQRLEAFQALSPEMQRHVQAGEIAEGMDTNAVFIAWGKPARVIAHGPPGDEVWVYEGGYVENVPYWAWTPDRRGIGRYDFRTMPTPRRYVWSEVTLANGRVRSWVTHPPPR